MKKNILHIIPYAFLGGTEKDCYYFVKYNPENNHDIIILGEEGPISTQLAAHCNDLTHLNEVNNGFIKVYKSLKNQLKGKKYDAVLYWSTIHLPIIRYVLKDQNAKLAVHIGNPITENWKTIVKNKILNLLVPSNIPTKLFACSEYVQKSIQKDKYLNRFDSTFSHNPVEPKEINTFVALPFDYTSTINIGMVARLDPIKDHETLLDAMPLVLKEFPNLILNLVGEGSLRKYLEEKCEKLRIEKNVVFYGNKSDVYEIINNWDFFIYSTTLKEGLGNVVTEALCNGLPVLVSDLPMMRELIGGNGAGMFFEPHNNIDLSLKLKEIILNKDLRSQLSKSAFERYEINFHPNKYVKYRLAYLFD